MRFFPVLLVLLFLLIACSSNMNDTQKTEEFEKSDLKESVESIPSQEIQDNYLISDELLTPVCPDFSDANYDILEDPFGDLVFSFREPYVKNGIQLKESSAGAYCRYGSNEKENVNYVYCGNFFLTKTDSEGNILEKRIVVLVIDPRKEREDSYVNSICNDES